MNRTLRTLTAAVAVTAVGLALTPGVSNAVDPPPATATPATPATAAVLPAPTGVQATRNKENANNFTVSWKAVSGKVDHYNVSVKADGKDTVTIVPAAALQLDVVGVAATTTYKITVSSRDVAGAGTTSGTVTLNPLVPGAPTKYALARTADLTGVTATWAPPTWPGHEAMKGYAVKLKRLSDGVLIDDLVTSETTYERKDLDPKRTYALSVTPINGFGAGPTVSSNVTSAVPASPTGTTVARDVEKPQVVHVSWTPPTWQGLTPVTYYEVVYGSNTLNKVLQTKTLTADVEIPYTITGLVAVRACNDQGCGYLGTTVKAPVPGTPIPQGPSTSTNPFVGISESSGTITVETRGVIGSTLLYPRLFIEVRPTVANQGFTDSQWGQNGAQILTFGVVPTGNYSAVVYGVGSDGKQTELARKVLVIGQAGQVGAGEWKVIRGKADLVGSTVSAPYEGENRVMSTRTRTNQDLVLTTKATLKFGWGYGVWFRSAVDAQNLVSGYTFQFDPKFGNKFLIRHWSKGTECSTPLATTPFPAGFQPNATHLVVVVAKGDTVFATVDGVEVFRVDSLAKAVAASPCAYPMPAGTGIGFRTWSTSSATFEGTTLS